EKLNEDRVNLGCHETEVNDDNILGKMFNTPEVYIKLYVCNKEGFKRRKADSSNDASKKR
ncbi:hypothetical protein Tco_1115315, partial [Tanacetum coccineum]